MRFYASLPPKMVTGIPCIATMNCQWKPSSITAPPKLNVTTDMLRVALSIYCPIWF